MFKTIEECRLDLIAASVPVYNDVYPIDDLRYDLDYFPASAARVSFGNEDKTGKDVKADRKLMKYLADHEHMTPFEHQSATFLVECPLFIRSQIMRHRTFAYNEISRRYTDENIEFWVPNKWRMQSQSNRQASTDEEVDVGVLPEDEMYAAVNYSVSVYNAMLEGGVCREQARAILPQSLLTKFYMTGNLRNWSHFVRLRKDAHAQKEVQVVARRIDNMLLQLWPNAWGVLSKEVLD